jgi:hypothetical protein
MAASWGTGQEKDPVDRFTLNHINAQLYERKCRFLHVNQGIKTCGFK